VKGETSKKDLGRVCGVPPQTGLSAPIFFAADGKKGFPLQSLAQEAGAFRVASGFLYPFRPRRGAAMKTGIEIRENEPMSLHTSFKTGGPAEKYAEPENAESLLLLLEEARRESCPVLILGGGANLLVADKGIRGLVIGTRRLRSCQIEKSGPFLKAGAGLPISDAAAAAADSGLAGLEFVYSMPGSAGGAVWMNARCYGASVSEVLESVRFVEARSLAVRTQSRKDETFTAAFAYKSSPFQPGGTLAGAVILETVFRLRPGDTTQSWNAMRTIEEDRKAKGHFLAPSAGSVFKNNRAFAAPAGEILDKLGFRDFALGGARVSPLHANIIINEGRASSADIRALIETMQNRAERELGFRLEPEIVFAGDWE
jgi:UDP-N-acetylmuramate dehydrogenase